MEREKSIELLNDLETTKQSLQRIQNEMSELVRTKETLSNVSTKIVTLCGNLSNALAIEEKVFNEVHDIAVTDTINQLKEMSENLKQTNSEFSSRLDNSINDMNQSFGGKLKELETNNSNSLEKMNLILEKNVSDINSAINSIKLDNAKTINDLRDLLDKKTSETMGSIKQLNKRVIIVATVFAIVGFLCGIIALVIALMK